MILKRKLLLFRFLFVGILLAVFVGVLHLRNLDARIADVKSYLTNHVNHEADKFEILIRQYINGVRLFAASTDLQLLLEAYSRNQSPELVGLLQNQLEQYQDSIIGIQQVSVATASGMIVASSESTQIDQIIAATPEEPVFLGVTTTNLGANFSTQSIAPVMNSDNQVIGYIEMLTWMNPLEAIVAEHSDESDTGELLVIGRTNQDIPEYIMQTRFNSEAAKAPVSLGSIDAPLLIAATARDATTLVGDQLYDYRGREVFAASKAIANSPWTAVVKIDKSEALAPIFTMLNFMIALALGFLIIFMIGTFFGSRRLLRALNTFAIFVQQLHKENYAYRVSLKGSDDLARLGQHLNEIAIKMQRFKSKSTKERQHKIDTLTKQIKGLRQQVSDLNSINEALVGRELRMKELKDRMKDLEGTSQKSDSQSKSATSIMQKHLAQLEEQNKLALSRETKRIDSNRTKSTKRKKSSSKKDEKKYSY